MNRDRHAIERAQAFCLRLPLRKPVLMAGTRLTSSDAFVVRLQTREGLVGWGEANAAPSHGGATLDEMAQAFQARLGAALLGQGALRLGALSRELETGLATGASAVAAIDMALHDLAGQALGVPAHVLLGGRRRDWVGALWLVGTGDAASDLMQAQRQFREGYRFFKLKVGVRPVQEEIALALDLRRALGPEARLCADANMGMDAGQAIAYAQGVRPAALAFLEQPLRRDDRAGLRRLVQEGGLPIGLDESILSVQDIVDHAPDGIGGGSLKTLKLGGMSGVVAAAQVCQALGLRVNLAGKIAETGIASSALLHVAAVVPDVDWGVSPSHAYLADDIVREPLPMEGGGHPVPTAPGLGVQVDEQKLQRWCIHEEHA